ncbi:MAG TPA: phosphoenolpyruvate carboxykinase, partial [Candidatus Bathyarchaeia archaeon]|nr:phosphoenolpyruvate carboxykinase [Candidatus Bathyarchaeia archaeon]
YRTFNNTIEQMMHLIRATYRDIQENITGVHPSVYRQVRAGAEVATIALPKAIPWGQGKHEALLREIPVIRQVLLYPPLILEPPMNKRSGVFVRVDQNPLDGLKLDTGDWLCYPAKVGELVILVYFHEKFAELGFSLSNLFEVATDEDLARKPDAVYLFGAPMKDMKRFGEAPTIFYEDEKNDLLIAAVPDEDRFGYFGYLKKMVLTLHNIKMMKSGRMPFHGALVSLALKGGKTVNVLLIGDTGAGKSETLEAMRTLGDADMKDMTVIADDMGSLTINKKGEVIGYGTEIGAFLRLDDLNPGYAYGQIDRAIIMSPSKVNARIVLPVTSFNNVIKGVPIHAVLYANNYEEVDQEHAIVERIDDVNRALAIFRDGTVMSKGTTTSSGIVHSYFANVFGPPQYRSLHEEIATKFFKAFYKKDVFVAQIRTRLGITGQEQTGPMASAKAMLEVIKTLDV